MFGELEDVVEDRERIGINEKFSPSCTSLASSETVSTVRSASLQTRPTKRVLIRNETMSPRSSPVPSTSASPPPLPPAGSSSKTKKRATTSTSTLKKPTKRARLTVGDDETTQVSNLDEHKLPFADGSVFYMEDFVDCELAQAWHDELLEIDGCTRLVSVL